jgi:hypothetical protein
MALAISPSIHGLRAVRPQILAESSVRDPEPLLDQPANSLRPSWRVRLRIRPSVNPLK